MATAPVVEQHTAATAHTPASSVSVPQQILDPGLCLTLRPMAYPVFYDMFRDGIKNTWTVEEVDFSTDLVDLKQRLTPAEVHLIQRLVAFFATRRLDRLEQPGAEPVQAHQLAGGAAVPVAAAV